MITVSGPSKALGHSQGAYPLQPVVAVGAVVFRANTVLLVKRGKPPSKGQWAIPGGSVRLGETLQAAAERELLEETGVTARAGKAVLTFDTVQHDAQDRVQYHYVIVDLEATYISGEPRAGDDADDARWVTSEDMRKLDIAPATGKFLREQYGFGQTILTK